MLKLELITDINRIITHRIYNGIKKCCTKGNSIDSRKFRVYGFVNKDFEDLYFKLDMPPTVKFYYSYETGEIWMTNPDVDYTLITNPRLKEIAKSIHTNRKITRVNMIANSNRLPDAQLFYNEMGRYIDEIKQMRKDMEGDDSIDYAVTVMLEDFVNCFKVMTTRIDGDNKIKTGNYGYNKKGNCLYRKPAKQRSVKRGKFSE